MTAAKKLEDYCSLEEELWQRVKYQRHHFADKGPYSQSYGSSSSHVRMWELDHKEGWVLKNWCFGTVVLEKILDSPLESKEIKPVNSKGNQLWILTGRTHAEAPILWPPDANSRFIGKDLDAGKDRRQKEKRVTEDEMGGWHHWCNGHELWQTPGVGEGQGSLGMLQSTRLQRVRCDLVTEQHALTAKHFKQSYTRAKKPINFIQPSGSHAVWSESFVCLIKCINTLESTHWGRLLSFQKRRPKQTNQQKHTGGCYGAMPGAPRAVSAMVLTDLCHVPSPRQQPGHSSYPWGLALRLSYCSAPREDVWVPC